jgi:hypothetical protein
MNLKEYMSWQNFAKCLVKKSLCYQCHINEQYTEWWEHFDQHVQCWTETQYENIMFYLTEVCCQNTFSRVQQNFQKYAHIKLGLYNSLFLNIGLQEAWISWSGTHVCADEAWFTLHGSVNSHNKEKLVFWRDPCNLCLSVCNRKVGSPVYGERAQNQRAPVGLEILNSFH